MGCYLEYGRQVGSVKEGINSIYKEEALTKLIENVASEMLIDMDNDPDLEVGETQYMETDIEYLKRYPF